MFRIAADYQPEHVWVEIGAIRSLTPIGQRSAWQALSNVGGPTWSLIGGESDGPSTLLLDRFMATCEFASPPIRYNIAASAAGMDLRGSDGRLIEARSVGRELSADLWHFYGGWTAVMRDRNLCPGTGGCPDLPRARDCLKAVRDSGPRLIRMLAE